MKGRYKGKHVGENTQESYSVSTLTNIQYFKAYCLGLGSQKHSSVVVTVNEFVVIIVPLRDLFFHTWSPKQTNQPVDYINKNVPVSVICLLMGLSHRPTKGIPETNLIHTGHAQFTVTLSPSIHTHPSYKQRREHEKTPSCDMPKHGEREDHTWNCIVAPSCVCITNRWEANRGWLVLPGRWIL